MRNTKPVGIMFITLGIAFLIIFKNSTPGTVGGALFIVAGLVALIKGRANRT